MGETIDAFSPSAACIAPSGNSQDNQQKEFPT